jgi:hypothetical protein
MFFKPHLKNLKRINYIYRYFRLTILSVVPFFSSRHIGAIYSFTQIAKSKFISLIFRKIKRNPNENVLHFLHVAKAGGNTIEFALKNQTIKSGRKYTRNLFYVNKYTIKKYRHVFKLSMFHKNSQYIFNVRDPISRFKSGFYSRKREGKPKYNKPHTFLERVAFRNFQHANDLAEALSDRNMLVRMNAILSMMAIGHVGAQLCTWFTESLLKKQPPFFVIEQDNLESSMKNLAEKLGGAEFIFPDDEYEKHSNDYIGVPPLSDLARNNLAEWYAVDLRLYEFIKKEFCGH